MTYARLGMVRTRQTAKQCKGDLEGDDVGAGNIWRVGAPDCGDDQSWRPVPFLSQ